MPVTTPASAEGQAARAPTSPQVAQKRYPSLQPTFGVVHRYTSPSTLLVTTAAAGCRWSPAALLSERSDPAVIRIQHSSTLACDCAGCE
jgi:hypothetical protein